MKFLDKLYNIFRYLCDRQTDVCEIKPDFCEIEKKVGLEQAFTFAALVLTLFRGILSFRRGVFRYAPAVNLSVLIFHVDEVGDVDISLHLKPGDDRVEALVSALAVIAASRHGPVRRADVAVVVKLVTAVSASRAAQTAFI